MCYIWATPGSGDGARLLCGSAYYQAPASTKVIVYRSPASTKGGVAYYLALLPLLLLLPLPLTTLFETYTGPSQFVEVNGNKIFLKAQRDYSMMCVTSFRCGQRSLCSVMNLLSAVTARLR